jgi:hypothetical protein
MSNLLPVYMLPKALPLGWVIKGFQTFSRIGETLWE